MRPDLGCNANANRPTPPISTFKGIFCPLNLLSAIKKLENERNGLAQFYANLSVLKFGGGAYAEIYWHVSVRKVILLLWPPRPKASSQIPLLNTSTASTRMLGVLRDGCQYVHSEQHSQLSKRRWQWKFSRIHFWYS